RAAGGAEQAPGDRVDRLVDPGTHGVIRGARAHEHRHGRGRGATRAGDRVGEGVLAREAGFRRVGDRAVGCDDDGAVGAIRATRDGESRAEVVTEQLGGCDYDLAVDVA